MNKKLQWSTVQKKIIDLVPQSKNPRKMSSKQTADLKKSLKSFGLVEIPVVDIDGTIIAGAQRLRVLQLLGKEQDTIDVRIPNRALTEKERDKYMIASNAIDGSWDFDKLKVFTPELLLDVGFDPIDISKVWDKDIAVEDDNFDEKKELEKVKKTDIELGDVIVMGQNRLICGDSTKKETLQKLFSGERCTMIYSDPIYNIDLDYCKGVGGKQNYGGNVQDKRTDGEYTQLMRESLECALSVSHEDLHVYYWADQSYIWLFQILYKELGIQNRRVCLWVKNGFSPTPSIAFNKAYEPCIYGTRGKPFLTAKKDLMEILNKDIGNGNATLDDIWAVKRLSSSKYKHATSKPPQLHEKAILRCTKPHDIILDSFAGSGSTLIACEQLKRRAYCVELEPIFCELIKGRWEKLTGKKAKVIKSYEESEKETIHTAN